MKHNKMVRILTVCPENVLIPELLITKSNVRADRITDGEINENKNPFISIC
jgi:hypothetical protein